VVLIVMNSRFCPRLLTDYSCRRSRLDPGIGNCQLAGRIAVFD